MLKDKILDEAIRRVQDFPKKGICFYDITGILTSPVAFKHCISSMTDFCSKIQLDSIVAVEARGFVFASPIAERLGVPLILVRKKGKLPGEVYSASYTLEYGKATIEVHKSDVHKGDRVVIIDDLIATGGTLKATKEMMEMGGAIVKAFLGVVGLPFLHYERVLEGVPCHTLIQFENE